eukprot:COSAG02_NODE_287_length_25647_cov_245.259316_18_plen_52_part_00
MKVYSETPSIPKNYCAMLVFVTRGEETKRSVCQKIATNRGFWNRNQETRLR